MKKSKPLIKRITARIDSDLLAQVKECAEYKRWTLNTFIEESLFLGVQEFEDKETQ